MNKKYCLKQEYVDGCLYWCAYKKGNLFNFFQDEYISGTLNVSKDRCIEKFKTIVEVGNNKIVYQEDINL